MKQCNTCNKIKILSEYHRDSRMADGRKKKCKGCKNKTSVRHGEFIKGSTRIETKRLYASSKKGKESKLRYEVKYRNAHVCRTRTRDAKRRGELTVLHGCESCESSNLVEAHHHDYNLPLDVTFLCRSCHKKWHSKFEPINREHGVFNPK